MPILHVQYDGRGQTLDGNVVHIPPSLALLQGGPIVQVLIGIALSFSDQLLQQGVALPQPVSGNALSDTGASTTCGMIKLLANLEPQGLIALIGRDYLQHCTLFYNGITGEITLSI